MEELLNYLNNYFYNCELIGPVVFEDDNSSLTIPDVNKEFYVGQYIKIENSKFNDGIFKVIDVNSNDNNYTITTDSSDFIPGVFTCSILSLAIPRVIIKLKESIEDFKANNKPSVYTSESFGNYSRSWATNSKGNVVTWKDVFKEDLNQYRCMFDDREGLEVIKWL